MQFQQRHIQIALVVAFYFFVSISLVFTNKLLLSNDTLSIPAPLFVTWFQCVVTVLICWALGRAGKTAAPGTFLSQFPEFKYDLKVARQILPLSAMFVGMIICNNLTLKYVEVSFYNVARSLTIVFNVAFTFLMLGSTTSHRVLGALAVVIVGFFVGAEGEVNFSWLGTLFGIGSSAFVSLNSIFTRKVLPAVNNDKWALSAYNNANAVIIFLPIMLLAGEAGVLVENSDKLLSVMFWSAMIISGIFGFLIGIATVLQIQTTSPLTHNISGTAKAAVQSIVAVQIWQNEMTPKAWFGLFTVLGGSLGYAYIRKLEMDAEPAVTKQVEPAPAAATAATVPAGSSEERGADEEFGLGDGMTQEEAEKAGLLRK